jgi:hypothetical protein
VYKPWIADAMFWPWRGFEAILALRKAGLHRNEWNSAVFNLNV